jgi:hypothetical protein
MLVIHGQRKNVSVSRSAREVFYLEDGTQMTSGGVR